MILSITLNPSIDISYRLPVFQLDEANRCSEVNKTAGGKGLNVSRILSQAGEDVLASGLVGGSNGKSIQKLLSLSRVTHDFLITNKESRNCIAILHEDKQTEILEPGPKFTQTEENLFLEKSRRLMSGKMVQTLSGSLPRGISPNIYATLIEMGNKSGLKTLLDCSGPPLRKALESPHKPFLIKPNLYELNQLLGGGIDCDPVQIKQALCNELFTGIDWIIITLGEKGAFVRRKNQDFLVSIPNIQTVNPVGSGDSVIAGMALSFVRRKNDEDAIKTGMAFGILNALEAQTGHVDIKKFDSYFSQIKIEEC